MYHLLFKNKLAALGFVVLTAAGAAALVGTEEEAGLLQKTQDQLIAQKQDFSSQVAEVQNTDNGFADQAVRPKKVFRVEYASDEHLIDAAEGYDPTPPQPGEENAAEQGETIILIDRETLEAQIR